MNTCEHVYETVAKGSKSFGSLGSPFLQDVIMQSSSKSSQHRGCSSTDFVCKSFEVSILTLKIIATMSKNIPIQEVAWPSSLGVPPDGRLRPRPVDCLK